MCADKHSAIVKTMLPAVVLAGGKSSRMKGDKVFTKLNGEPLIHYVIKRIHTQVSEIAINSNDRPEKFDRWNLPVISDICRSNKGPLAGILAGMSWAKNRNSKTSHIISVPTDTPFLPRDLVMRLIETANETGADIVVSQSSGQAHFVAALWSLKLDDSLLTFLRGGTTLSVEQFISNYRNSVATFSGNPVDPFLNVNTPKDLEVAEHLLRAES